MQMERHFGWPRYGDLPSKCGGTAQTLSAPATGGSAPFAVLSRHASSEASRRPIALQVAPDHRLKRAFRSARPGTWQHTFRRSTAAGVVLAAPALRNTSRKETGCGPALKRIYAGAHFS